MPTAVLQYEFADNDVTPEFFEQEEIIKLTKRDQTKLAEMLLNLLKPMKL